MRKKLGKLAELSKLLKETNITTEAIEKSAEVIEEIKRYASQVQDYRNESYVRHVLADVIMITFFAVQSLRSKTDRNDCRRSHV